MKLLWWRARERESNGNGAVSPLDDVTVDHLLDEREARLQYLEDKVRIYERRAGRD